jgi:hypothetical protein
MLYPKLISMNCRNFDFDQCIFTEKLMKVKDKREEGKTREGAGRVAIHKGCGNLVYSYTLECNYIRGSKVNMIAERYDHKRGMNIEDDDPETRVDSWRYADGPPAFTSEILWDIGRACCISLLDLIDSNSRSRIHNAGYKNSQQIQLELMQKIELQQQEQMMKEFLK